MQALAEVDSGKKQLATVASSHRLLPQVIAETQRNEAWHLRPRQVNKSLRSKQQIGNKKPFNINIKYCLVFFRAADKCRETL